MRQKIPHALRIHILERDDHSCHACGSTERLHIDHIIPQSKGGLTIPENLQILCSVCNRIKDSLPFTLSELKECKQIYEEDVQKTGRKYISVYHIYQMFCKRQGIQSKNMVDMIQYLSTPRS